VVVDRSRGHTQPVGDLPARQPTGGEQRDLPLADAEREQAAGKLAEWALAHSGEARERFFRESADNPDPEVRMRCRELLRQVVLAEFRRTGKVRATLGEDDKVVRQLYATEVAKVELSSLDARWPREVGKAHGAGAPARVTLKPKQKPPQAKAPPRPKPQSKPKPALDLDAGAPVVTTPTRPEPKPQPAPKPTATPGASLAPDDNVIDAPSIGQKTAGRLQNIGVATVADLLAANPEKAAARLNARHITPNLVRDWQAQAALACALPGLRAIDAQLLVLAGVRDTELLAAQTLDGLISKLDQAARTQAAQDMMRGAQAPNKAQAERWIAAAQALPNAKAA
jgi:predicted flap endonuclease-1-like 5' DNA nuclease